MHDNENPARQSFLADQEDAELEEATRDQTAWALNVRNGAANALQQEAHAAHLVARAYFWNVMASGLTLTWVAVLVLGVLSFFGIGEWS